MKSVILVFLTLALVTIKTQANHIDRWLYWFDDDFDSAIETVLDEPIELLEIDTLIDVQTASLSIGIHRLSLMFRDTADNWNILSRNFYYLPDEYGKLSSYEYWFDNNVAGKTVVDITGEEFFFLDDKIDFSNLSHGLNSFTFRFKDSGGIWSIPLTSYFYNTGTQALSGDNAIKAYRYWFGDDNENMTFAEFKSQLVEIDFGNNLQIPPIEEQQNHRFGIQFMNQNGIWSVPITQEFLFDEYGITAPYLIAPTDNHNESLTQFNLQWADQATIEKYHLQVSTKADFSSTIVDINDIEELDNDIVEFDLSNLTLGYKYFWRVRSIKGTDISLWSEEWNFMTGLANQDIALSSGWNIISTFINPQDADIATMLMPIEDDIVIVKNNLGQIYYPEFGINDIGNWDILEGYQVYMTNAATLSLEGLKIVPEDNPIELNTGWNIISYFRTTPQNIETAMMSLTDDEALVIAKNNLGQIYYPQFGINDIENMLPGQGYQIYLIKSSTFFYKGN